MSATSCARRSTLDLLETSRPRLNPPYPRLEKSGGESGYGPALTVIG
jgi:hypothetical protein